MTPASSPSSLSPKMTWMFDVGRVALQADLREHDELGPGVGGLVDELEVVLGAELDVERPSERNRCDFRHGWCSPPSIAASEVPPRAAPSLGSMHFVSTSHR
jgi:hypothetical protein